MAARRGRKGGSPRERDGENLTAPVDRSVDSDGEIEGRPATLEELEALGEDARVELIDGVLYELPVTTFEHGDIASLIVMAIGPAYQLGRGGPGGWWIQGENDFVAEGREVFRPDAVGWRKARLPAPERSKRVAIAPDWVLEVLSPGTRRHDLVTKAAAYARIGVGYRWYVDPVVRSLEAFALRDGRWELVGCFRDDEVVRVEPFEAVEVAMADWWDRDGGAR